MEISTNSFVHLIFAGCSFEADPIIHNNMFLRGGKAATVTVTGYSGMLAIRDCGDVGGISFRGCTVAGKEFNGSIGLCDGCGGGGLPILGESNAIAMIKPDDDDEA